MEDWQIDGINRLENTGYMDTLRNLVRSHASPFWWFDESVSFGKSILHNGTICFVNIGNEILGITANHVYEEYLKDKNLDPLLVCQMGSVRIEPEKYVKNIYPELDLVSFSLPSVLVAGTQSVVHNTTIWPPPKLKESDLIILGGYPGNRRNERIGKVDFDFVSFIGRVSQSSDDHASIHLNIPESYWPQGESVGERPDLGGVSGGPVFLLRMEPIEIIEYAGIIYECGQSFELVFARHAAELQ